MLYAALAVEVSSDNVDHFAILTFDLYASGEIREEFVSFIKMEQVCATDIEQVITRLLTDLDLSLTS